MIYLLTVSIKSHKSVLVHGGSEKDNGGFWGAEQDLRQGKDPREALPHYLGNAE